MVEIHAASFDYGWKNSDFQEYLNGNKHPFLGIFGENGLEAFVIAAIVADEAEILTIATDPSVRRKGYGRALMQGLITDLKTLSVRSLFLEVAVDNPAAIALYEGLGFRKVGRRPFYYSRKGGVLVDALILSLAIPSNSP
ncbi:MAG: ribosomal protein S18-alanine N-acetyltransferase [Asticcacaulis sp.]